MHEPEGAAGHDDGRAGEHKVPVAHAEHVPEQKVLDARRRGRRQGQERTEPEQDRDHDRHRCVAPDGRNATGNRDPQRRDHEPRGAADEQRNPRERGDHEPGEQSVRRDSALYDSP